MDNGFPTQVVFCRFGGGVSEVKSFAFSSLALADKHITGIGFFESKGFLDCPYWADKRYPHVIQVTFQRKSAENVDDYGKAGSFFGTFDEVVSIYFN